MFSALAAVVVTAFAVLWFLLSHWQLFPLALAARLAFGAVRFALLPAAAKKNYPAALRARFRWRWLAANLGLSYLDEHRKSYKPVPFGASHHVDLAAPPRARLRFPRARIRADEFGIVARVRTVPKVTRAAFEDEGTRQSIADYWKCCRVQVSQPKPGRLIVRGLKLDPLTLPLPMAAAPPGVYGADNSAPCVNLRRPELSAKVRRADNSAVAQHYALRLYLGRDEWGTDRWLPLSGITGITVGGLPGYGKTAFILSLLHQLAGLPVAFVFIDGKGSFDYADWEQRAWISTGDELPAAAAALEDAHALMRHRFATVLEETGHRNAWHAPLSPRFPVVFTVVDECHSFFDVDAVKGDREAERQVRACRALAGQLVRKGRSVLMITVFITQKQTSDAIPTAIRDNCTIGLSFATKTTDASVAALGEQVRQYPGFDPVTLQARPDYIGVCTASLPTGADPFVRIRVPEVTGEAAAVRAAETACKRLDPRAVPALPGAAETPALEAAASS